MYNPEYISYMNEQIKKVKEKLISEFLYDLKQYNKHIFYERSLQKELTELIQKWEEKS